MAICERVDHKLWWKKGEYGRGLFVISTGQVITWPDIEMTHSERMQCMPELLLVEVEEFYITSDGHVQQYMLSEENVRRVVEVSTKFSYPKTWRAR